MADQTKNTANTENTPAETTAKTTAKKTTAAKSTAAKSTAAKKPAATKSTTKSTASKSTAAKKPAATKSTTAKSTATKSTATKSTATKSTASKSTAAKKTTATKSTSTKSASAKKTATKKPAVKEPEIEFVKKPASQEEVATAQSATEEVAATAENEAVAVTEPVEEATVVTEPTAEEKAAVQPVEITEEPAATQVDGEPANTAQPAVEASDAVKEASIELITAIANGEGTGESAQTEQPEDDGDYLLRVRNLKKYFPIKKDFFGRPKAMLRAVDDVSFDLRRGKTLGIVGESGCGKTTMGRTILKLHEPTDGQIYFNGLDIAPLKNSKLRPLRTKMQIIFQDPYSSLPPRMPVGGIIGEAVKYHKIVPAKDVQAYVLDIMDKCGLRDYYYERYPHEFSGGQRQRICIARALAVNPQLIVCDEPVSALDVSIQAQIINLLKDLQKSMGLTYLFISHDLSVVKHISDEVGVMYLGSMVEFGPNKSIFNNPMHPYTDALFSAVPVPDPKVKMNRIILSGDIPSPANPPTGCKFHTRCPRCMDVCSKIAPVYREYEPGHFVACHLYPQT